MFETLTKGFRAAKNRLSGLTELTEENIDQALRDVRLSLLEADVELGVTKRFLATVKERAANGCPVLGTRFTGDLAVGSRFDVLTKELGDNFIKVEMPGIKHATTTLHRQQKAVDAILDFFATQLKG